MKVKIERFDHLGNGIGYFAGKIIFVPFALPSEEVEIEVIKKTKNYLKGKLVKVLTPSSKRIKAQCPYFEVCGGCELLHLAYKDTVEYKLERAQNILGSFTSNISFVENASPFNYRNKIELKVKDGKFGFYEAGSHSLREIDQCLITKEAINNFIPVLKDMQLKNGEVTIRCNFNDEILVYLNSPDPVLIDESILPKYKVVGIIHNEDILYGENKFLDKIDDSFFEVSYNSFFQVNSYINVKLFALIKENVQGNVVLDLYSGVGTLSIMASKSAQKVYAIEVIPEAVVNAIKNAKINKVNNVHFILGKVEDKLEFIEDEIDTVIVDPPRSGLDSKTIGILKEMKPEKIIYISCETQKLKSDLEKLIDLYNVESITALDMFSYSYHVECVCILKLK